MITKEDIKDILSQTYARVALQENSNMRLAADLYESLRPQLYNADPSDAWDYILIDKIKFDNEESIPLLIFLVEVYFKVYFTKQLMLLSEAEKNAPDKLVDLWTQFYADAAVHFREDFICMLCHQRSKWDKQEEVVKKYTSLARLIRENRWPDAYPIYEEIAINTKLDTKTRVLAEVILAEIIMYNYPQPAGAAKHLEHADKLLRNYFVNKRGWAEYYLKNSDPQKARNALLQVISEQRADYLSFDLVGDCFAAEGNVESAESWYNDAIQINFLQTDSFKRLINLYADKKLLLQKQTQIDSILKQIEERQRPRNASEWIEKGIATPECFKDSDLYQACRDIGAAWFANENPEKAEEWFLKAIDLQPGLSPAIIDMAYLKLQRKDFKNSKEYFLKALKNDRDNFEVFWGLAYYYEQQHNKEEALKAYEHCLRLRPHWSDWVNNFIGNVYYSAEDYEHAAAHYRKAVETNNDYIIYKQNLADALQLHADQLVKNGNKTDDDKAEELYLSAANTINTAEAWNTLGNFYFKKTRWQQAIDNYNKAIALNNAEPVYYENRGLAYEKAGIIEKAEESYNRSIELDNKTGKYYNRLGLFYYNQKEYEKAIMYYLKALEREPEDTIFLDNIAMAYEQTNERDKAEPYYLKLLQKEPDNDTIMNLLGVMYYKRGDYEKALFYYNMAISKNDKIEIYHENLAILFRSTGNTEEAIREFENALGLNQANDINWNEAGNLYFNLNNYDKALEYYSKAVELKPDIPVYHENIGLAYEKKQLFAEAISNYQDAIGLNPDNARVLNSIGLVYHKLQDFATAKEYYLKAIDIDSENWMYYTNLGLTLREAGYYEEAIDAYKKALDLNKNDYLNWNELGVLFFQKENFDEAVSCYKRALELELNDAVVFANLAVALNAQGKTDEAAGIFSNYTLNDEMKEQVESMLQQYYTELNDK